MPDLSVTQILTYIGITVQRQRQMVTQDLIPNPDRLRSLLDETQEGIEDTCASYTKLDQADRFRLSRVVVKRLIALMCWARDQERLDLPISFPGTTDQVTLLSVIQEASARNELRISQKKLGDALISSTFENKLKNRAQWERWCTELKALLNTIIGAKGVPLAYVLRDPNETVPNIFTSYEHKAIWLAPHNGMGFEHDRKAVHNVIIRNTGVDSDAYIYLKPALNQEDGAEDMRLLRDRYDNPATVQEKINEANKLLENLVYKNERALSFEKFSGQLKKGVDILTECERAPHDGDIVDGLWKRIQNAELAPYVNALKVQNQINPRSFREILQDIASQVPNLTQASRGFKSNLSSVEVGDNEINTAKNGECPAQGVMTEDGELFIGSYPAEKWKSDSVKPFHQKILNARKNNSAKHGQVTGKNGRGGSGRSGNWKKKFIRKNKRTLSKLRSQINELKAQAGVSENRNEKNQKEGTKEKMDDNNIKNAGTAFGGRRSRSIDQVRSLERRQRISPIQTSLKPQEGFTSRCELDSHADTTVAGKNCMVMNYTDRACTVHAYSDDYEPLNDVPIIRAATGYTSRDGRNYILVLNEALWMPRMDHSLINPNQLRDFGVTVQDNPYDKRDPISITTRNEDFTLCLKSSGATIYFNSWTPSLLDLENYPHIILSSDKQWNPQETKLPDVPENEKYSIESKNISSMKVNDGKSQSWPSDDAVGFNPVRFCRNLIKSVRISSLYHSPTRISNIKFGDVLKEDEIQLPYSFLSKDRHSNVTPEDLSERWGISVAQAALTLGATTRNLVRSALMPLSRRYRVDRMFGVNRLRTTIATDTMDARVRSIHGERYCQVFASKQFFVEAYPITQKSDCHEPLESFVREYGAPDLIITDGSKEQTGSKTHFVATLKKYDIPAKVTEPDRHNQNPAEGVIRELRKKWYRTIFKSNCPAQLWNYGLPHVAAIMSRTASFSGGLEGRTPLENITGETVDISEYLDFGFWDRIWFKEDAGIGPVQLGRFLGISHHVGSLMSYWVLPASGIPESRTTVQRVTVPESKTEANIQRFQDYDRKVAERFKEGRLLKQGDKPNLDEYTKLAELDEDFIAEFDRTFSNDQVQEADKEYSPEAYDKFINMEVAIDRGNDHPELGIVKKRLKGPDGNPIGVEDKNPKLDTRMYEIEYTDGYSEAISANVIAENLFAQVDEEGRRYAIMDQIIDHRRDGSELSGEEAFLISRNGVRFRRKTTKGWEICVLWKDRSTSWHCLKDIKDSYPVELAEYAKENQISHLPAFAWWVPHTLKKRERIIAKIKSKYWVRTHKYGIRIPKSVEEAIDIDKENGNTLWWDALMLEMKNVRPAFEIHEKGLDELPIGYSEVKCHVVWDVKLGENFRRKARFVAGGHTTEVPQSLTYSSVVSRESVRIALTVAALNGLDILLCDIQNAYLSAKCREKRYIVAGPEFGIEQGSIMIVKMALYGLKSSGAAFRAMLANVIYEMGYRSTKADPDVWIRPAVNTNGQEYYEMILCYVDDVLSISHSPMDSIDGIKAVFKLKGDKAETPKMYLGCSLLKKKTIGGQDCWAMSSHEYVKQSIITIELKLKQKGRSLPKKCATPFSSHYHPSNDTSVELDGDEVQFFQEIIGILRWAIELGRVDILLEVALLSQFLANPRQGHLDEAYHIFGYLKNSCKRSIYLDPGEPPISELRFKSFEWEDFYRGVKEPIPKNMPNPRGKPIKLHAFVDSDHAGDRMSRRSQTGILIFCNRAPVTWVSKKQNSVQNSTFGSEFCALKHAIELIEGLRYKLRMFGIPLEGPSNVYCDNESVFKSVSIPTSVLSKKHHSIAYHYCREAVAMGTIRIAKEDSRTNLADVFTKPLPKVTRESLFDMFTY